MRDAVIPEEAWYEFDGIPVKWQIPVGVLYDYHMGQDPAIPGETFTCQPWTLTLRFKEYPNSILPRTANACHDNFVNSSKEVGSIAVPKDIDGDYTNWYT